MNHINPPKTPFKFLKATDIQPKDDSYHGNINLLDIEWWYFDAVFDNDYSIHVGVRIYHIRHFGLIQTRINLYHHGTSIKEHIKAHLFNNATIHPNHPTITINQKPIITFDYETYKKTGQWIYHINLEIEDTKVNLTFTGTTQGWKIETTTTCWTVPLPKAHVTGTITTENKQLNVNGKGYHDHNWSYSPTTVIKNLGWYWGRITADTLNLTWAHTKETPTKGDLIAILNKDHTPNQKNQTYYNINPKNINFSLNKYTKNNRKQIPTHFKLQTHKTTDPTPPLDIDIQMTTKDVQYTKIFIIHYWRYHVLTSGHLSIGKHKELFDKKPQIIEYLSFKS